MYSVVSLDYYLKEYFLMFNLKDFRLKNDLGERTSLGTLLMEEHVRREDMV